MSQSTTTAPTFGYRSTAEEVAAAYGSNLPGKVVIVTGSFGGLGKECARVFAKYGAHVILGKNKENKENKKKKKRKKN